MGIFMKIEGLWQASVITPALQENDIHLWLLPIRREPEMLSHFHEVLSLEERRRAQRFRVESARSQFICGRGFLRRLLGGYLDCPPQAVQFTRNEFDKPYVFYPETSLHFNLSHSGDFVLCGFRWHRDLGVDIEECRPNVDIESISRRYFARNEIDFIFAQNGEERLPRFFRVWTRKEAVIKALGTGISDELLALDIPVDLSQERLFCRLPYPQLGTDWTLMSLPCSSGYEAAMAVQGTVHQVQLWVRELGSRK